MENFKFILQTLMLKSYDFFLREELFLLIYL